MLISIVLILFVYQILFLHFEYSASNADTLDHFSIGSTKNDQNLEQDDADIIKPKNTPLENLKNEFITSFDDKHESSEVSSIIPLTPTSTIEPSFIPPQPSHSTITSSTDSSFISPFPNIINFNNSSSNIKNDLKTNGKDGSHSAFNPTNNHFVAQETNPTFANNINKIVQIQLILHLEKQLYSLILGWMIILM